LPTSTLALCSPVLATLHRRSRYSVLL
jgi:hypothetical protein